MEQGKLILMLILIVGVALLATSTMATDNHEQHNAPGSMGHGRMQSMNGMEAGMAHGRGVMVILGEDIDEGVKAICHLMPIDSSRLLKNSLCKSLILLENETLFWYNFAHN